MGSVKTVCSVLCLAFALLSVFAALMGGRWAVVILSFIGIEALVMALIARNLEKQKE
jgi:energy-coupling factor transporter transmembrane protein EcfT